MPLYTWIDVEDREVSVVRSVEDRDKFPTPDECNAAGIHDVHVEARAWRRKIGEGIRTVRGRNWTGSKGNW